MTVHEFDSPDKPPVPEFTLDPRVAVLQAEIDDPEAKEVAFASIVEEFESKLKNYAAAIAGPNQAEDIVQDTFINAFLAMDRLAPTHEDALSRWLFRIARNRAYNELRRDRRTDTLDQFSFEAAGPEKTAIENSPSHTGNPQLRVDFKHAVSIVGQLEAEQREALTLTVAGVSYEEIAKLEGISVPAVKGRIARGRIVARRILNEG